MPQSAPGNTTTPLISSSNLVVETFRGGDGNCPLFFTMHGLGSYDTLLWNYMSKNTPMWLNGRILSLAGPKCFSFKFKIVVFFYSLVDSLRLPPGVAVYSTMASMDETISDRYADIDRTQRTRQRGHYLPWEFTNFSSSPVLALPPSLIGTEKSKEEIKSQF